MTEIVSRGAASMGPDATSDGPVGTWAETDYPATEGQKLAEAVSKTCSGS